MIKRLLVLLLFAATSSLFCYAQEPFYETYEFVNNDTVTIYNCRGNPFILSHNINNSAETFDGCVIVDAYGAPFTFFINNAQSWTLGTFDSTIHTYLRIWDGDSATGTELHYSEAPYFGTSTTSFSITSGRMTIRLHHEGDIPQIVIVYSRWEVQTFTTSCPPTSLITNLTVDSITHHSAYIHWMSSSETLFKVTVNGITYDMSGNSLQLENLQADEVYNISVCAYAHRNLPCCGATIQFITNTNPCTGCPNFADMSSYYVRGHTGTFYEPYRDIGIVDNGPEANSSRHTVHTDTTETDPRTGGQLRTVCPGTYASARLGNWMIGAEAEALTYNLAIDTDLYALLLLHYAVVLQNPGHPNIQQPRFKMEILDSTGHLIDPICGAADFSANDNLGWNYYQQEGVVWKDWTTVGFDMTPYHGQTVLVRFTTYDCEPAGHYGYAYFSATCALNSATTEYCGSADSNVITAPDGFNYLWFYDSPDNPISTNQTVYFSNNDELLSCYLISKENPNCYVTLNTYAGHRWPLAVIDTLKTESLGCDGFRVYFINRSTITNDNGDTIGEHCESARWYFGDSFVSTEYSPQHIYHDSGDYLVVLVAGIAGDQCLDTGYYIVHVPDYYIPGYKDTLVCDSMVIDGVAYTHDTVGPKYRVHHDYDCDTVYTLNIHIYTSPYFELPPDTFCYSNTYTWHNQQVFCDTITRITHYRLLDYIPTGDVCDSVVALPLVQLPPEPFEVDHEADCTLRRYTLTAVTDRPYLHWSSSPHDPLLEGHESDRQVFVQPTERTFYTVSADQRDTFYCPTKATVVLDPPGYPTARLKVNPEVLTYDQMSFDAYDISHENGGRHWSLVLHPDGDTMPLADQSSHLQYTLFDPTIDSLVVILTINNGSCLDTAQKRLPFIKTALWVPNAFTPDEGDNNRFTVTGHGLQATELYIYDRAGRLIYSCNDATQGWDGTHDGRPCPQGAYVWLLRYLTDEFPNVWQTTSGTVTLIR